MIILSSRLLTSYFPPWNKYLGLLIIAVTLHEKCNYYSCIGELSSDARVVVTMLYVLSIESLRMRGL